MTDRDSGPEPTYNAATVAVTLMVADTVAAPHTLEPQYNPSERRLRGARSRCARKSSQRTH
jgi:hypothetical protein